MVTFIELLYEKRFLEKVAQGPHAKSHYAIFTPVNNHLFENCGELTIKNLLNAAQWLLFNCLFAKLQLHKINHFGTLDQLADYLHVKTPCHNYTNYKQPKTNPL